MKETWHFTDGARSRELWSVLTVSLALSAVACGTDSESNDGMPTASDAPHPTAPVTDAPSSPTSQPVSTDTEQDEPSSSTPDDPEAAGGRPNGAAGAPGIAGTGGVGGFDNTGAAGASDADGGEPPTDVTNCSDAGGVCVPLGTCEQQDGTIASGASDCIFDDGAAECCVPPAPQPDGTTCEGVGGICTSIGGCLQSGGHSALPEVTCEGGPGVACCVAHEVCGDADIECCSDGVVFRPACDNGEFVCAVGDPYPVGGCPG